LRFPRYCNKRETFQAVGTGTGEKKQGAAFALKNTTLRPLLCQLESKLVDRLTKEGFVQVVTPILLSKGMLNKMTITSEHPLVKQVFWVDKDKCLRPMLAPNLYHLLKDLRRLWGKPVKIFEVGPVFVRNPRELTI